MERYKGGSTVAGGYYWNQRRWSIVAVPGRAGRLEGDPEDRFIRAPLTAVIPLMLLMSGLFVVFLPLIGFCLLGYLLARQIKGRGEKALRGAFAAARQSLEAHLAKKRGSTREANA